MGCDVTASDSIKLKNNQANEYSGERIGCSPCRQEVEGSNLTGGTCPNNFSNPTDQDIPPSEL